MMPSHVDPSYDLRSNNITRLDNNNLLHAWRDIGIGVSEREESSNRIQESNILHYALK